MRSTTLLPDEKVMEVLSRFMSPILARSVFSRALSKCGIVHRRPTLAEIGQVLPSVADGARLFVEGPRHDELKRELMLVYDFGVPAQPTFDSQSFKIRLEADISTARTAARVLAEGMGAPRFAAQRVATVVSELARNIVNYTPGGELELVVLKGSKRGILVRAVDSGSGIPNLDEILSGKYRSSTGLGAGIVGTQRLANRCQIKTGPTGTTIEAEFHL